MHVIKQAIVNLKVALTAYKIYTMNHWSLQELFAWQHVWAACSMWPHGLGTVTQRVNTGVTQACAHSLASSLSLLGQPLTNCLQQACICAAMVWCNHKCVLETTTPRWNAHVQTDTFEVPPLLHTFFVVFLTLVLTWPLGMTQYKDAEHKL